METTKQQAKKLVESLLEAYPDLMDKIVPQLVTHDGVELYLGGGEYWSVNKKNNYICDQGAVGKYSGKEPNLLYFSTQQAAQSYLDSLKPKPVFTTFNSVEVFDGQEYWCYNRDNKKIFKRYANKGGIGQQIYVCFSTESLANAYQKAQISIEAYTKLVDLMAQTGDCDVDYEDEIQIRHCIDFFNDEIIEKAYTSTFCFLAFKTKSIMQKFHKDNLELIKQFYKC